jgi:hypothetical protein
VVKIGWLSPALALVLGGCMLPPIPFDESSSPRPMPSVTQSPQKIDEDAFWAIVEDARARGQGDPDRMAAALDYRLYDANDETIRAFQEQLVAASMQLYTWRHGEAAELICGRLGPDEFTDWRSWVISLGRDTFTSVAANPDNIADVQDLEGGCWMAAEQFGWTAFNVYWDRHQNADGLAGLEPSGDPSGVRIHGNDAIRAALPKVAART